MAKKLQWQNAKHGRGGFEEATGLAWRQNGAAAKPDPLSEELRLEIKSKRVRKLRPQRREEGGPQIVYPGYTMADFIRERSLLPPALRPEPEQTLIPQAKMKAARIKRRKARPWLKALPKLSPHRKARRSPKGGRP
ncbi:MAG: hypothetical protein ABSE69_18420 [Roseiarcus sp.]|jgi:hypothetical protein